jgi:tetratricopeptide (TPR) repeat protein
MSGKQMKGRYLQNIGAYYEKQGSDTLEKAMEYYKKALVAPETDDKIFNLIGSLYLKIIDRNCKVNERCEDKKLLTNIDFSNQKENVERAIIYLTISRNAKPNLKDSYVNLAKAYMYRWAADGKKTEKDKMKAILNLEIAEGMEGKSGIVLFTKRNLYEIQGDLRKAVEVNTELEREGFSGDVAKVKQLYEEK